MVFPFLLRRGRIYLKNPEKETSFHSGKAPGAPRNP